ncbi:hypothetical protein FISHEDRAFT_66390 [Fistulina hepatica ATCC 64428]|uniref:RlpA-like protein double-psi beta-barrel domain-containing protein n=1 Tax=Fistulina hepatica ATCC 64428 TaxID=1128425 RepID=A0A0D7A9K8_9AGAR|nr:hypothetical protein FISHEDRAFT_66390 [Fistulina hepatica ATCC 64428]
MPCRPPSILTLLGVFFIFHLYTVRGVSTPSNALLESRYIRPHALADVPDNYNFDPRDGWQAVNVTDMQYKYRRSLEEDDDDGSASMNTTTLQARDGKKKSKKVKKTKAIKSSTGKLPGLGSIAGAALAKVLQSIQPQGKPEPIKVTWYTGNDLKNPSCWPNGKWSPTDASFIAALSEDGKGGLQLCNTPQKCTFARVGDTCAGCKEKHIDLTRAAFGHLASYEDGVAMVQMRPATNPADGWCVISDVLAWFEELWGPK